MLAPRRITLSSRSRASRSRRQPSGRFDRAAALPERTRLLRHSRRPLDPTGAVPGRISIYFEFYPHTGPGKSIGTLVATEGGPGYPATLSRDEYLALFKPLRQRRDVLLMDNRGTGQSGAIDCRELQTAEKWTVELNAACGRALGESAPLYSTAYAADDLAAILDALDIRRIDLYGDSYGTYFEQVFAIRHPNTLRSIVLDGAYPLNGPDYAWYPSYAPAMRDKFNIACRRFEPCARLPGSSIEHILPLLDELRSHPFPARAADSDGKERDSSPTVPARHRHVWRRARLCNGSELDAAARAFADGDRAPVLRLMAETMSAVDSRDPNDDAAKYSAGLAAAVMCQDPPQIFDMRLPPELRTADRDRAVATQNQGSRHLRAVYHRRVPRHAARLQLHRSMRRVAGTSSSHPASHVVAADPHYPDIPALIISGNWTISPPRRTAPQSRRHSSTAPKSALPTAFTSTRCRTRAAAAARRSQALHRTLSRATRLRRQCAAPALDAAVCRSFLATGTGGRTAGQRSRHADFSWPVRQ